MVNISGSLIPFIKVATRYFDRLPCIRAFEDAVIFICEHLRDQALAYGRIDVLAGWPDVPEINRVAIRACAERFFIKVDIHTSGQCISNDQGR